MEGIIAILRLPRRKLAVAAFACILTFGVLLIIRYRQPDVVHLPPPEIGRSLSSESPGAKPADGTFLSLLETVLSNGLGRDQLEALYFSIAEYKQINCSNSMRIGSASDGGWDVCFDAPFDIRRAAGQAPCVAFSFGINYIYEYDDALVNVYKCRVHMFDPSMTNLTDHQRLGTSWFYRTGLSGQNYVAKGGWKMRTLCTLFKQLGYSASIIDILKIDVEHWEWESFEAALAEGCLARVKQLLFESHTTEMVLKLSDYNRLIRVWFALFRTGFRTWKWHRNPESAFYQTGKVLRPCCYEHYMINTRFL